MNEENSISSKRGLSLGVLAGVLASLFMAAYAMAASFYQPIGFFTPLYHIAAVFIPPKAMNTSVTEALQGRLGYLSYTPALVGALVHMMVGGIAGGIFGLWVARVRSSRAATILAGEIFGLIVMIFNSYVVLPMAARLFKGGEPISHMAQKVGWEHFAIEHLIYGVALGLLLGVFIYGWEKAQTLVYQ